MSTPFLYKNLFYKDVRLKNAQNLRTWNVPEVEERRRNFVLNTVQNDGRVVTCVIDVLHVQLYFHLKKKIIVVLSQGKILF